MDYRRLGRSDLQVSSIGLGAATFGREIDERTSCAVMDRAFERGITLFDTAEAYGAGRSEEIVGRWIASRQARHRIVLATKVSGTLTSERVLASAEASLRRLQVDGIDLFQLHSWDAQTPLDETLDALNRLVESGKARYVGCSNAAAWQLCKALWRQEANGWPRLESVQAVYNLAQRRIEHELLPLCADQQLGVVTYSPLGAGFLTGKYRRGGPVPKGTRFEVVPGHQDIYFNAAAFRVLKGLRGAAKALGVPMAQLALAWITGRPGLSSVLIGARSTQQVDQVFEARQLALPPEVQRSLDVLT